MAVAAPLALIAGGIGAGVSAVGTLEGGAAAANAADYQAQVARNNAIIARQKADYAIKSGQQQAATQSMKGAATGGKIKANQAASGVDVNSGSAADVQTSQRELAKLDSDTVLNNAELKAWGYRTEATSDEAQAQLSDLQAEQAPIGAALSATGGLLSSASSLGGKWATTFNPIAGVAG
ncbi:hypothetical protein SAMN05216337_1017148 [Bradyrhizobium brasilense]|uniref:Uncharacterized protein n=1 Tax=Bradyrhizobium brasilense TaxID=1419277 RepID=A0A1G6Z0V6_9BRAD|nr:hypothetical protein [Bradyrhizobium brasilense]SDD95547.1 hypothetical protein SAMN05216337_1017148 [Bradyrhizobium brasilense]